MQTVENTFPWYLSQNALPRFEKEYELMELIDKMMKLNPNSRWSAQECLGHDFFKMTFEEHQPFTPLLTEPLINWINEEHELKLQAARKKMKQD